MKRFKVTLPTGTTVTITCASIRLTQNEYSLECLDEDGNQVAFFHQFQMWTIVTLEEVSKTPAHIESAKP